MQPHHRRSYSALVGRIGRRRQPRPVNPGHPWRRRRPVKRHHEVAGTAKPYGFSPDAVPPLFPCANFIFGSPARTLLARPPFWESTDQYGRYPPPVISSCVYFWCGGFAKLMYSWYYHHLSGVQNVPRRGGDSDAFVLPAGPASSQLAAVPLQRPRGHHRCVLRSGEGRQQAAMGHMLQRC